MITPRMDEVTSICAKLTECQLRDRFVNSVIGHVFIHETVMSSSMLTEKIREKIKGRITHIVNSILSKGNEVQLELLAMVTGIPVLVMVTREDSSEYCEILYELIAANINSGMIEVVAVGGLVISSRSFFRTYSLRMAINIIEFSASLSARVVTRCFASSDDTMRDALVAYTNQLLPHPFTSRATRNGQAIWLTNQII